jgi:putrescine transport system permease protein
MIWKYLISTWHKVIRIRVLRRLAARATVIAVPYGWHIIFFLIPFLIVLKISFSESIIGSPPYTEIVSVVKDTYLQIRLNISNYLFLIEESLYIDAYLESLKTSGIATILCLFISYPIAYGLSRTARGWRSILLMLVILPFWTSFLIRVCAWMGILNPYGFINSFLMKIGIISEPLPLIHNDFAVCLGIVYSYLPFMIFPLYIALEKIDYTLLEAAYDLGCKPWQAFLKITLPLSVRGILAGSMLVFIPGVGEYVIPELLGGSDNLMIGRILWTEFFMNRDWPLASALAVSMLVVLVLPIIVFQKLVPTEEKA